MYPDVSLRENVSHGTASQPVAAIHFRTGEGTPYPERFFVERHWHHTVEIIHIVRGEYSFEINLENYLLKEGDVCFLNGEDLHQITGNCSDTIHDVLIFDPKILGFSYEDELEEQVIAPFLTRKQVLPHVLHPEDPAYHCILPLVRRAIDQVTLRPDGWYVFCKLLLIELLYTMAGQQLMVTAEAVVSEADRVKIERYKKLISYMESHYHEQITLEQLGDVISCNPQYLCRIFKEITGTSPIQYLIDLRVEYACKLLKDTGKPILEIGMDCGFENTSYFIRKFRQLKGCTPKEYRRRM